MVDLQEGTNRKIIYSLMEAIRQIKADATFSKRKVYSTVYEIAQTLIDRDARNRNLYQNTDTFQTLCLEMEEVSKIQCDCADLDSKCTIVRSKIDLPKLIQSINGPVVYSVNTVDITNSKQVILTTPTSAALRSKVKGNSNVYAFIQNNRLYLINRKWENVNITGLFEEDVKKYSCNQDCKTDECIKWLDQKSFIPQRLLGPVMQMAFQQLAASVGIPMDQLNDKSPK